MVKVVVDGNIIYLINLRIDKLIYVCLCCVVCWTIEGSND